MLHNRVFSNMQIWRQRRSIILSWFLKRMCLYYSTKSTWLTIIFCCSKWRHSISPPSPPESESVTNNRNSFAEYQGDTMLPSRVKIYLIKNQILSNLVRKWITINTAKCRSNITYTFKIEEQQRRNFTRFLFRKNFMINT